MTKEGRRSAFSWVFAPDDADGASACVEIEAWLRERDPGGRDWESMLSSLRDRLILLQINPVIRGDAEASRLFASFADCRSMAALDACCDELARRVAVLLALRANAGAEPGRHRSTVAVASIEHANGRIRI